MRTITTYNLRDTLASCLEEIGRTETPVIVSRFGKPIAVISPFKESDLPNPSSFFGFLDKNETGEEFLGIVRRSKEELERTEKFRAG